MPYNDRIFRPNTFAPRVDLPQWVPMGEEEQPDMSPLMGALKQKLTKPSPKTAAGGGIAGAMGGAMPSMGGGAAGGGKMSL